MGRVSLLGQTRQFAYLRFRGSSSPGNRLHSAPNHTLTRGCFDLNLWAMRKKLTPKAINALPPAKGKRYEVFDALMPGVALYCALEDNQRRLQRRMRQIYGDESKWPVRFHFSTQMSRLNEGGLEDLRAWIFVNNPAVIIIDPLIRIRPGRKRDSGYDTDYAALTPLQELAGEFGISIVVIHHLRKMAGDDPLDMVSGTTGLTGAVDTVLVLHRGGHGVTLYGRGREIEEIETAIEFKNGCWEILGEAADIRRSEERNVILEILAKADKPMTPKVISAVLNLPPNNVKQLLFKMLKAGEVQKKGRGRYILPVSPE